MKKIKIEDAAKVFISLEADEEKTVVEFEETLLDLSNGSILGIDENEQIKTTAVADHALAYGQVLGLTSSLPSITQVALVTGLENTLQYATTSSSVGFKLLHQSTCYDVSFTVLVDEETELPSAKALLQMLFTQVEKASKQVDTGAVSNTEDKHLIKLTVEATSTEPLDLSYFTEARLISLQQQADVKVWYNQVKRLADDLSALRANSAQIVLQDFFTMTCEFEKNGEHIKWVPIVGYDDTHYYVIEHSLNLIISHEKIDFHDWMSGKFKCAQVSLEQALEAQTAIAILYAVNYAISSADNGVVFNFSHEGIRYTITVKDIGKGAPNAKPLVLEDFIKALVGLYTDARASLGTELTTTFDDTLVVGVTASLVENEDSEDNA